ncbi:MAG: hypothetical protein FGM15_02500 [Chthoniobacterales bacterium]|nr:hypothetical protein [Chthoniobacterales bacterium]
MKKFAAITCLTMALSFSARCEPAASTVPAASEDKEPSLRARVLEFSGGLCNEGFKVRDGFWSTRLDGGAPARLAVNLFAGNRYWFCAAAPERVSGMKITLFDPRGEEVKVSEHRGPGVAAAGMTAVATGRYVVQVESPGGAAEDICLVYLFK